ncbi:collagen alpha-1(XII) chain-like, partial [Saccostrea cucullata]|uniref:collagen alpha-1(XII) chain-like n=1 Tax=Saccostrea cuccullata TaxID=36930 RepID=UPI002ED6AB1B
QPKELRAKHVTPFEIELNWEPPNTALRRLYTYTISYHSKNSQVSTVRTKREVYVLKDLVPDVVYTIWIAAEKEGLKGDPTDPIECHTPRCGPQNLQVDALERQVRVYWDEAVVPSETESLNYKVCLQNENSRAIEGEVLRTPEAKYDYACYFRDLWTDTNYTLVMTTIIDEGDWDPPTELQIKTRRDPHISDLEPHDNNFLVAYSNTLGIEVGEKKVGGIFLPTLLESLREHYDSKNIVEIMEVVDDEVQNRSAVTGKIKKVITVNTLLARPRF